MRKLWLLKKYVLICLTPLFLNGCKPEYLFCNRDSFFFFFLSSLCCLFLLFYIIISNYIYFFYLTLWSQLFPRLRMQA
jgi:hypothetical protein